MCNLITMTILLIGSIPQVLETKNNKFFHNLSETSIKAPGTPETKITYVKIPSKITKISENSNKPCYTIKKRIYFGQENLCFRH